MAEEKGYSFASIANTHITLPGGTLISLARWSAGTGGVQRPAVSRQSHEANFLKTRKKLLIIMKVCSLPYRGDQLVILRQLGCHVGEAERASIRWITDKPPVNRYTSNYYSTM